MENSLSTFFDAWSETDADKRQALIAASMSDSGIYSDPRSGGRLSGAAISDYVGMFSANAPGWTAKVVSFDYVNGYGRAIVAFGGQGPDGSDMVQHGTYFAEANEAGALIFLSGFVGTGAIE